MATLKAYYRILPCILQMHSVHEDELSRVAHKVGHWTNDSRAGLGQGTSHDEVKQGLIGPTLVRIGMVAVANTVPCTLCSYVRR